MPRSRSTFIQSERARRCSPRALTAPAIWMAPPNSSSFSVKVVLPASGCAMIAKVRRRATAFSRFVGMCLDVPKSRRECRDFSADFQEIQRRRLGVGLGKPRLALGKLRIEAYRGFAGTTVHRTMHTAALTEIGHIECSDHVWTKRMPAPLTVSLLVIAFVIFVSHRISISSGVSLGH